MRYILLFLLFTTVFAQASTRVIIGFKSKTNMQNIIQNFPTLQVKKTFTTFPLITARIDQATLENLINNPAIAFIEEDRLFQVSLNSSNPVIGSPNIWALNYTGQNITVAILDTGVEKTHDYFATYNKVVSEACYSTTDTQEGSVTLCPDGSEASIAEGSGVNCTIKDCNHGTHVAGIVAGNDSIGPYLGVAKDANIIAIQVFSEFDCDGTPCAQAFFSDILAGLERVYELRDDFTIAAVNLSLGGGKFTSNCDTDLAALKLVIDNLKAVGIATIIASGNQGYKNAVNAPGCISSAITVGATEDDDDIASFSNIANLVDFLAPGVNIISSIYVNGISSKNGTSMATPHIAGAFAVLKQAYPNASVDEIYTILQQTATILADNRSGGIETNLARINLDKAVAHAKADINQDAIVDINDFYSFYASYGSQAGDANYFESYDYDNDGDIDAIDYQYFYQFYLLANN